MAASRPSASIGLGMPAMIHLDDFGRTIWEAFGHPPYLVGSSATGKTWRDVDVRLILPDDEYANLFGAPTRPPRTNSRWAAMCAAFAELGRVRTGLPVDFQIQQQTEANELFGGSVRVPLGIRDSPPEIRT